MSFFQKNIFTTIVPILISLMAFGVSVRSCSVSEKIQKQSISEYQQERLLILTAGAFEEKKFSIKVKPIDNSKVLLEGDVHFPKAIYQSEVPINADGNFLHMGSVEYDLKQFLTKEIPPKKGYTQVSSSKFPIIIRSYYAVKGQAYTDISLYMLTMTVVISENEYIDPEINLEGLIFVQRYKPDKIPDLELLDRFINKEIGIYILPKAP